MNNRKTLKTDCIDHLALPGTIHLVPMNRIGGYEAKPGFYKINGTTAIPGKVNFTVYSHGATAMEPLLFRWTEEEPYVVLPFPKHYRIGNVYSMIVFKLNIGDFEYAYQVDDPYELEKGLIFDKNKYLLGPYAKAITGQNQWGDPLPGCQYYKARVVKGDFDWAGIVQPPIPMGGLIIYELHVRGFTTHDSSTVLHPGTFDRLAEEFPYLLELGVDVTGLIPMSEFDEIQSYREMGGRKLHNYWGYNTASPFASSISYTVSTEYNQEGNELRNLIWMSNQHGIEVYLDVVFNHTAEGNENGPFFSFRGFGNNIYHLLTLEGCYYDFGGCDNILSYDHPIVRQTILNCLRYWATACRTDRFHSDLVSTMARDEDGAPMSKSPLLQSLVFDPILGDVKLITEARDADGLYQVGTFPSWNRWVG